MDTDKLLHLHGKKTKWVLQYAYIVIDRDEQFEYTINSVYDRIGWLISYSLEDLNYVLIKYNKVIVTVGIDDSSFIHLDSLIR